MKILLTGYEGSKRILPISSYLLSKYVPDEFDIKFLNYGEYNGKLYRGEFISLDGTQVGGGKSWSRYVLQYLQTINDKYIILGVDDHLIGQPVNMESYQELLNQMADAGCCRLSYCNWYDKSEYDQAGNMMILKDTAKYRVTGQYTLWDRKKLMEILKQTNDIWDFESRGGSIFNGRVYAHRNPPFKYDDRSALSGNNPLNLSGVLQEDIDFFEQECLINHNLTLRE